MDEISLNLPRKKRAMPSDSWPVFGLAGQVIQHIPQMQDDAVFVPKDSQSFAISPSGSR
jgi:hypothetical protein